MAELGKGAVLIAGPTASGKSALALTLAKRVKGVVINADSMQVYRHLRVITARPTIEEEQQVPHRLYGHVDEAENYSVGRWCRDVSGVLEETRSLGKMPIFVGGTGLYFRALTTGLSQIPAIPADIRACFRSRLDREGVEPLYEELQACDPTAAARLMPRDRSRILRALEVVTATGRTLTEWHREDAPPLIAPGDATRIFLDVERTELVRRITSRFDAMLAAGAVDEVRALDSRGLSDQLPAMKAHGVPWLRRYLRGEISLPEAASGAVMDTRRYTKRQVTWFRNQMPGWAWLSPQSALSFILA